MQVLEHFNYALKADKARPQIAQLTELGLVELTRKRQGQNIYELFGHTCPTCGGLGHIMRLPGDTEPRLPTTAEVPDRFDLGSPQSKVSLLNKEPRLPTTRITEPRESYDSFGEVFDADSDIRAFDSINHPSYQEPRDTKQRRVRKSSHNRIGINGANGKEESRVTPLPLGFDNEPDLDADIVDFGLSAQSNAELRLGSAQDLGRSTPEIPSPNLGKSGWHERAERTSAALNRTTKVTKVEPVKPVVEPPEIRSVEMTLEEQDVFALMGVSPLVKLDQDVKSPKSVIVNIISPDAVRTKPTESTSDSTTVNTVSNEVNTSEVELEDKPVLKNISASLDLFAKAEEIPESKVSTGNRRRRRRS